MISKLYHIVTLLEIVFKGELIILFGPSSLAHVIAVPAHVMCRPRKLRDCVSNIIPGEGPSFIGLSW
jgi:hypothetical protein